MKQYKRPLCEELKQPGEDHPTPVLAYFTNGDDTRSLNQCWCACRTGLLITEQYSDFLTNVELKYDIRANTVVLKTLVECQMREVT